MMLFVKNYCDEYSKFKNLSVVLNLPQLQADCEYITFYHWLNSLKLKFQLTSDLKTNAVPG